MPPTDRSIPPRSHDDGLARRDQDQRHRRCDLDVDLVHRERARPHDADGGTQADQHDQRRHPRRRRATAGRRRVHAAARCDQRGAQDRVFGHRVARRGSPRSGRSSSPACGRRHWRARRGRSKRTGSQSRAPRDRASRRRSPPWCRHRRRASDRRTAGSWPRSPAACASTTFCWLPPDSVPAACSMESALMLQLRDRVIDQLAASARRSTKPRTTMRLRAPTARCSRAPACRAAGPGCADPRAAAPCRSACDSAWPGPRIVTGFPQTSMLPSDAFARRTAP